MSAPSDAVTVQNSNGAIATPTKTPPDPRLVTPQSNLAESNQRAHDAHAAATAVMAAQAASYEQLQERVRALELENARLKADKENGGGKIEDVYHVSGSDKHRISGMTWVKYWQEKTKLPLPTFCPCQHPDDNPGVPHKLHQHTAGAHVIFRTADDQLKVGIVPVCKGCNSGRGKPIVFECLAVTIFDVGAQTYVGELYEKSEDENGKEATNMFQAFDSLSVSTRKDGQNEVCDIEISGTGVKSRSRTLAMNGVDRVKDDFYYASVALTAMGGLTKNHPELRRHDHKAKVYKLNEGGGRTRFAKLMNRQGHEFAKSNDYDRAKEMYRKAIELDPKYAPAYNNLGHLFMYKQPPDYNTAATNYQKAIDLDPKDTAPLWNLSFILERQKNISGAIKLMEECISLGGVRDVNSVRDVNTKQRLADLYAKLSAVDLVAKFRAEAESPAPAKDTEPENSDGGHTETKD
jgi:tetratricopeptide (TPR) repeat protein